MTSVSQLSFCEVKSCMFVRNKLEYIYLTRQLFHWRKKAIQYCGCQIYNGLKLKNVLKDFFITNTWLFTSQDINWSSGVVESACEILQHIYQLFGLSFWRHPYTAEDLLVKKWCNHKFLQICSDEETNLSTDGLRVNTFSANFHFWVNYSFESFSGLGDLICFLLQWDTYVIWCFHANLNVTAYPHLTDLLITTTAFFGWWDVAMATIRLVCSPASTFPQQQKWTHHRNSFQLGWLEGFENIFSQHREWISRI